jgi:hypothetical protein
VRRVASCCVLTPLLLAVPASAAPVTEQVAAGPVTAELSYSKQRDRYGNLDFRSIRVKIARAGVTLRDEQMPRICGIGCVPANTYVRRKSIRLRDLDADGEPEVIVALFTGGANCCSYLLVYGYRPLDGTYGRAANNFGTYGYRLMDRDRDRVIEFRGGDLRFRGAFQCGACGPQPIRIWRYRAGAFRDVTRRYPGLIRADARRTFKRYLRVRSEGLDFVKGHLTPYVADQCLLRRCRRGLAAVQRAYRRGELSRRPGGYDLPPYGKAYIRALVRFLGRSGYWR